MAPLALQVSALNHCATQEALSVFIEVSAMLYSAMLSDAVLIWTPLNEIISMERGKSCTGLPQSTTHMPKFVSVITQWAQMSGQRVI